MTRQRVDNVLFVILTVAVVGIVTDKIYESDIFKEKTSAVSLIQNEINWASAIEGCGIMDVFKSDSTAGARIRETKKNEPKFIVILSDSSCRPCFGNLVKDFIVDLKRNQCAIDPSQWIGCFVGEDNSLGESTFRGVFGGAAKYMKVKGLDRRFLIGGDALILCTTGDNTILACSRIGKRLEILQSYFVERAANALHARITEKRN